MKSLVDLCAPWRQRNANPVTEPKGSGWQFPEVKDSIAALDIQDAIIDGEIVALDEKGRSSFQLLQSFDMGEQRPPIVFYAFDLLPAQRQESSKFTDRRTDGEAGRTAEKAAGCHPIFGVLHKRHPRASGTGWQTWAGRFDR
jgi:hypothetical protein